jgi:hypothetical protein
MVTVTIDKKSLEKAIKRNPTAVRNGALLFMRDSINSYWRAINNTPAWRVGESGGGVPVATGNLRKAHQKEIAPFESKVFVNKSKTKAGKYNYANLVHDGTPGGQMEARPWLTMARESMSPNVKRYMQKFLKDVVLNLAK